VNLKEALDAARSRLFQRVEDAKRSEPDADLVAVIFVNGEQIAFKLVDRENSARHLEAVGCGDLAETLRNPPTGSPLSTVLLDSVAKDVAVIHDEPDYLQGAFPLN
jgi:hypothetical protein